MSKVIINKNCVIVELAVNIFKQGREYIADCPSLALSTHGKTVSQTKKDFEEALKLWIEVTVNRKTLKTALLELGWKFEKISNGKFMPKPADVNFTGIPIELLAQKFYPLQIPYSALS